LITVVLVIYASWNGWNYWQHRQAAQAAVLYDTFEKAVRGKDDALMTRSLTDLQDQFARTTVAQQASLLAARIYVDQTKLTEAEKASLRHVLNTVSYMNNQEGFISAEDARQFIGLSNTKAEATQLARLFSEWKGKGIVKFIKKGQWQFVNKPEDKENGEQN
jgi:hypothetical protein